MTDLKSQTRRVKHEQNVSRLRHGSHYGAGKKTVDCFQTHLSACFCNEDSFIF